MKNAGAHRGSSTRAAPGPPGSSPTQAKTPTRRDSQPAVHKQIRQQLDGTDFSAAVYDMFVVQATGRQRSHPRAGPGMGIDL